jgi:redox-sensitive bicupin YhaK (pirin superfamily)
MTRHRKKRMVIKARPTLEGAGVHLKRAIGFSSTNIADPFLLLDHFHSDDPGDYIAGFPWHPHRGIETITYMLEGMIEHGDSMGNKGVINPGDVQWMTAGSGIIHQEMPKGSKNGSMHGFQLWANLPAADKMMEPRYREVLSGDIPHVKEPGALIRVIAGAVGNVAGPVRDIVTDPEYLDVTVEPGVVFSRNVKPGHTVIAYVIEGDGNFGKPVNDIVEELEKHTAGNSVDNNTGAENLIIYADGDSISVKAGKNGTRFLLISGKPINEPIAWSGPIVMNTEEELRIAFEEYENGTFLKHKA